MRRKKGLQTSPLSPTPEGDYRIPQFRIAIAAKWGRMKQHEVLRFMSEDNWTVTQQQLDIMDQIGLGRMIKELDDAFMASP